MDAPGPGPAPVQPRQPRARPAAQETNMLETYEQLKQLVGALEDDVRKAAGGNKAAGTRVRKSLQEVKNVAQNLRVKVLEQRDESQD